MQTIQNTDHAAVTTSPVEAAPRIKYLERRLTEAFDQLWDDFVDPAEAVYDVDGTRWNRLGGAGRRRAGHPLRRRAATGRNPRTVPRPGRGKRVRHQRARKPHQLHRRQRARLSSGRPARGDGRRCDRRRGPGGHRRVRPAEPLAPAAAGDRPPQGPRRRVLPTAVRRGRRHDAGALRRAGRRLPRPDERRADPAASFGVQTDPDDVETVLGYWIDGRLVDARPRSSTARRTSTRT